MRIALLPSAYHPSLGGVEELSRHLALTLRAGGDQVLPGYVDHLVVRAVQDGLVLMGGR